MEKSPMGPCPRCRRHVLAAERTCPFCGLTRREVLIAVGALLVTADTSRAQEQAKYGGARPTPDWAAWNHALAHWRVTVGLSPAVKSWSEHKVGTSVAYSVTIKRGADAARKSSVQATLDAVAADSVTLRVEADGAKPFPQQFQLKAGVPKEFKVTDLGKEELAVDGKKFNCDVKSYDGNGIAFKVWHCADAPSGLVKVVQGGETTAIEKLDVQLTAAGKARPCTIWVTTSGATEVREWQSKDVPGLMVKRVETVKDAAGAVISVTTVEATAIK